MPQFNEGNINSYLVPSGSLTGSLSNSGTLTGQIAIGSGGGTSDYNDLSNKPSINSVTLSGNKTTSDLNISYNDLDDKPTIPTELDDLSDVDTTGALNGLVLTYYNGTWAPETLPQELPPYVEELRNFEATPALTAGQVLKLSHGAPVTKWTNDYVSYNELTDRPTIPDPQVNSDWNASSGVAEILNKPTLATVATSGDYDDLSNTPDLAFEDKGQLSDLNNVALDNGGTYKYIYNAGASNKPGTGGGTLLHFWNSGNHAWGAQLAISDKGLYFRNCNNSTFGTWNTIVSV